MSIYAKLIILVGTLTLLSACATTPTAPTLSKPDSAGVGLSVKVINSMIVPITYKADAVYFSKLCATSEPCDTRIYISSFAKDGRIYWLDAPPGEYVAVATSFRQFADPNNYITYFPEALIQKTKVRVDAGKFAYLGDYTLSMSLGVCPNEADASQLRYAELFSPNTSKCGFFKIVGEKLASTPVIFIGNQAYATGGGDYHYRGTIKEVGRDKALFLDFISQAKRDLADKNWESHLEQAESAQ